MHPRFLVAGIAVLILILALVFYFGPQPVRDLGEKVVESAHEVLPFVGSSTPKDQAPGGQSAPDGSAGAAPEDHGVHVTRRTELIVRTTGEVHTQYGLVRVPAGTHVIALKEEAGGVRAKFADREMILPMWLFESSAQQPNAAPVLASVDHSARPSIPPPPIPPVPSSFPPALPPPPAPPAPLPPAPAPVSPSLADVLHTAPAPASTSSSPSLAEVLQMAAATPPPVMPRRADSGVAHFAKWLLIAKGEEARGSASVILLHGVPTIVTNAHVMSGNPNVKFRSLDSKEVPTGAFSVSQDYDLVTLAQSTLPDGIPVMENVDKNVSIGDDVMVLGNSQGSSVVTEIRGKINGIGPDLIEVDAKFVEGNSGSPIIHAKTGQVIAIATFATVRKRKELDTDSQFAEVRRFGYRLDTATRWEQPSLRQFASESATLKELRKRSDALVSLAIDIHRNGKVTVGLHQSGDNPLRVPVGQYLQVVDSHTALAPTEYYEAKMRFLRNMATIATTDLRMIDESRFTGFHRKAVQEEHELREFLAKNFEQLADAQDASRSIVLP